MQGFRQFIESNQNKKAWRGKPEEVIAKWRDLPITPIYMDPVPVGYKGRKFSADSIRLTGRGAFISATLSHLKDVLKYDNQSNLELGVEYKELSGKSNRIGALKKEPRYVTYIHCLEKKPKAND